MKNEAKLSGNRKQAATGSRRRPGRLRETELPVLAGDCGA